jgi:hypothetical protein
MAVSKRTKPIICVRNESSDLTDEEVAALLPGLQKQVDDHFEPVWGLGVRLEFNEGEPPRDAYVITVRDEDDEGEGFIGYHFRDNGYPEAFLFAKLDLSDDKTISETLSHEILEMLVDPSVNLYAYRPGDGRRRPDRGYFYEVCDAVQCHHYKIDGVKVCNFVYPEWFEHSWPKGSRQFDHLGLLDRPFQILPGCYMDVYEAGRGDRTLWGTHKISRRKRHRRGARTSYGL